MDTSDPVDEMDVPSWMRLVADSDTTERILAKAGVRRRRLDEARGSADPNAHNYIDAMDEAIAEARIKWEPGTDLSWWTTASRNAAVTAYVSAHEFSEIDSDAGTAADQKRAWFKSS